MLLLAASVALAATHALAPGPQTATAASTHAPVHRQAVRPLRFACASNLYNAKKVLHYVARASDCHGSGKTLVTFSQDYPVYTCRKEHGGFAARQRRFQFPNGIRSHGPAGLMRLVDDPAKCAPNAQPNETPITLPQTTARMFCAAKSGGELRWVNSARACDHKEFPVRLAARAANSSNPGDPVARNDSATTDEDHSTNINVLANDKNTSTSSSNAGLHVGSTDTTGTKGTVTVNPDDTITYDPHGQFESLKPGQTATDTFKYTAKKGGHTSAPATVTVTITGVNDAPVARDDTGTTDSAHSTSIAVLTNDTDADGDSLSVASVDTTGTHGTVTINGNGTVTYNPNHQFDSLAPGESAHDTFKYKANDGHADSNAATVDVTVTGQDDPPVITTTSGNTAYTESAPAVAVDGGITVTDPDSPNLESARIQISPDTFQSGDILSYVSPGPGGITGFYDTGAGVLNLTGHASQANWQAALRTVKFRSDNDNPATTKMIQFTANDGNSDSAIATKQIAVTNVNDAPTVTTSGGTSNFTEDSPATQVDAGITATDPDSLQFSGATVSITSNFTQADGDTLGFTNQNGITGSYSSASGVLTLTGNAAKSDYEAALRSITFSNTSDTPSTATRTVSFKVRDNEGAASLDSNTATEDVSVTPHNDAPTVTTTSGSTSVAEDAQAVIDSGVTVTDPDDTNIESGQVRISSGFQPGDSLIFTNTPNITGSYDSGTGVLTLTGSDTKGAYANALQSIQFKTTNDDPTPSKTIEFKVNDGDVDSNLATKTMAVSNVNDAPVVDLNGSGSAGQNATAAFTEDSPAASVAPSAEVSDPDNANLASATITLTNHPNNASESLNVDTSGTSITASSYDSSTGVLTLSGSDTKAHYQQVIRSLTYNNSSNTPDTSDRVVNVKVNDGSADSNEPHSTVSVTAHNDAPTAVADSYSTNEDTPLTVAAPGVLGNDSDPDSGSITAVLDTGPSNASSFTLNSDGSFSYTPNADFNGSDSFTYHANDGSADSNVVTVSITVNPVNDAPVTDLNGTGSAGFDTTAAFTEDSGPVQVAPSADITDVDSPNLASATITLTTRPNTTHESLAVNTAGTSITATAYDNSTGVITLSGSDTPAHYQQVIRSIQYDNSSNTPDTSNRLVTVKVNDGSLDSNTATSTVSVTAHNDAPTANDQSGLTTNEDTALPITLSGSDPDGDPLTFTHDSTSAAGGTISGSTASVSYTPAQDYCSATPDTFGFTVDDGNGGTDTGIISITVSCVNDAPVVDLNGAAAGTGTNPSFAEQIAHTGGATTLAPNGTVSDVDNTQLQSLTVTLTNHPDNGSEFLTANTTGTSIIADAYNSGTGVLLLHGTDTVADYQQVLRTVAYENDAAPPNATDRTIDFVANDGALDSNTAVSTVSVVPLNAPPVTDLNGTGTLGFDTNASFTEDSGPATLAPNADVTDADDPNLVSATVTLTNRPNGGAESLSASVAGTSITADAYVPATGVLFLHGSDTVAHYQQVLRTVAYNNSSNTPDTTNRSIEFKVNDGQDDSNVATATTSVTAHNDAPTATDQSVSTNEDTAKMITLSGTDPEGDSLTFTYDSTSAQGGTITGTAPNVTYTPPADYNGPDSFNFTADDGNGGTDTGTISITVDPVNDAPVVDLNGAGAGIDNNAAFTENQPAVTLATGATVSDVDNANLSSATVTITNPLDGNAEALTASTSGTSITGAYNSGTGVLSLSGSDTKAHYQQVLQSVAYNDTSDTPNTTNRDITWKVNDGSLDSTTAHTTLSVTAVNDPPTLDLNGAGAGVNETAGYTEDQPATTLAPNTVASDPDNANLQSATVTLTNHPDGSAESLSVDTSGTSISAVAYNSSTGVLSLSGNDSVAHYQQVLRTVKYLNTSQNADATNRVVNFVANDGSDNSNSPTVTVTITVVNDPPVVDMNGGGSGIDSGPVAFTEDSSPNVVGSGPVNLDSNGSTATVSDVDNANLSSATLTLTNHPDGVNESLSVNLAGTSITSGGYNSSTGVLTLTGPDTTAHFQQVIRSAKYNNVSNTPDPTNRDITTKVNDGAADSTVAHTTVTVTPTNDAPVAGADTFNATNSAIGNTTLNVNDTVTTGAGPGDGRPSTPDPTDTSPVTDRPHKEITGNIFANDTDPDSPSSGFTATPGTFATNDGGTVTIQADGDFNFEPAPSTSCTDHSDFFNYTVNDNSSTDGASSTGTVTVAITGCVWYANNDDAQGNSGTSEKPFDTLAQAQTASSANDTIFVYDGNDTTTGYNAGVSLKSGQTLQSEAATLTVGSDTLHSADSANKATLTNNNADVVLLNNGTTVKGLNIDPQGTGGGICGGTACGGNATAGSTLDDVNITDSGTKGTQAGLELNGSTGTFNISNLTVDNGDGSSATTGDEGVKLNNAGTVNFASTGTISITTNGAAALDAAAGGGTTSLGSASTFDDITVTNSANGGVVLAGTTGSGTAFGDGSGNDLQLTTTSGSAAAFGVQTAGSFSVPSAGQSDLSATGGPAVNVTGSSGSTMSFDGVSSTNSATQGINLSGLGTGTFSAQSGTLGGYAGTAVAIDGGSGAITLPETINNGTGDTASVNNRTGGVITVSGSINDTNDAGGGISASGNSGGSAQFTGTPKTINTGASPGITASMPEGSTFSWIFSSGSLNITTTSGKGFEATGVAPTPDGNIQVSSAGNTIDTGTGRALNVTDVNVNSTGETFQRISSNGATTGINLSNTGSNTALTVQGTGGTCSTTANCTGGAIQSSTGPGIQLASTGAVNLTRMAVANGGDDGIRGTTVNGFSMDNSVVSGNGNAATENGFDFSGLTGTVALNTDTVSGNAEDGFLVDNTAGTLSATFTNGSYSNQSTAGVGNDGILVRGGTSASETINVQGPTFASNRGDHIQMTTTGGSPSQDLTVNGTTMTSPASGILGGGITVSPNGSASVVSRVTNNSITNSVSSSVNHNFVNGTGTMSVHVTGNTLTSPGADEVQLYNTGSQTVKAIVANNSMSGHNFAGIDILSGDGDGSMNVTATGNTISGPGTNAFAGIFADMGTTSPNSLGHADQGTSCLDIGGAGALQNSVLNSHNATNGVSDIRLRHRFNTTVQLPGYTGAGIGSSLLTSYLQGRNSGNGTPSETDSSSGTNGWTNSPGPGGACPQPAP